VRVARSVLRGRGCSNAPPLPGDALSRVASTTDGLGRTTVYGYDANGNQVSKQDPGGNCSAGPAVGCTTMTYDAGNQLVRIDYSDGETVAETFSYDADGRQTDMQGDPNVCGRVVCYSETTSSYDSLGRLTRTVQVAASMVPVASLIPPPITFGYDLAGHVTSIASPSLVSLGTTSGGSTVGTGPQTLTRSYDAAGRMRSVTSWTGNTTTFGYDANSNLASTAYPNGTEAIYSYDPADHTSSVVDTGVGGVPFLSLPYTHDANGRIATDNPAPTLVAATQSYGYDPAGRLASASLTPTPLPPTNAWSYDPADHLTQISHLGQATTTLAYDAADELTSAAGVTFTYDARGNRTGYVEPLGNPATYVYDRANRLTSYTGAVAAAVQASGTLPAATTQAHYYYQPDGLRADMLWDRAEGMPLILSSPSQVPGGLQEYVTGPGGRVVEIDLVPVATPTGSLQGTTFTTTQTVYVHADAMGSTRAITDPSGKPLIGYTYDPYGQASLTTLSSSTTSIVNPFLFQGQYVDPLTGLMYLRARWYDPTTAQFLTRDPLVALTRSAYGYAAGDPVNGTDPTGLCGGLTGNAFFKGVNIVGTALACAGGGVVGFRIGGEVAPLFTLMPGIGDLLAVGTHSVIPFRAASLEGCAARAGGNGWG
jgi:RHS repeat-associated protein